MSLTKLFRDNAFREGENRVSALLTSPALGCNSVWHGENAQSNLATVSENYNALVAGLTLLISRVFLSRSWLALFVFPTLREGIVLTLFNPFGS